VSILNPRRPREFHHRFIYVDERKERLKEIEERAKRELGLVPEKEISPEELRGTFTRCFEACAKAQTERASRAQTFWYRHTYFFDYCPCGIMVLFS
jgi:hypothetical protein